MLLYHQCSVSGNIPGYFPLSFLVYKASEAPDVYVLASGHGILYHTEKRLNGSSYIGLVDTCFFSNFINYVRLGHSYKSLIYLSKKILRQIYLVPSDLKIQMKKTDYQGDGRALFF